MVSPVAEYLPDAGAKKAHFNRHHIQAVIEIPAKTHQHHLPPSRVAAINRTSTDIVRLLPTRCTSRPESPAANVFPLTARYRDIADFIETMSRRQLTSVLPTFIRAGKRAFSWPERSDSSSDSLSAAQLSVTSGLSLLALQACSARATNSLPVPGLRESIPWRLMVHASFIQ